jgi:hypothetical protein
MILVLNRILVLNLILILVDQQTLSRRFQADPPAHPDAKIGNALKTISNFPAIL